MSEARWSKPRLKYVGLGLLIAVLIATLVTLGSLWSSSKVPVDAYLVLGGSIRREIYVAELAGQNSLTTPILISTGSSAPCIRLLFEQAAASLEQVWLENCARSTFGNFVYTVPLLDSWGIRHVALVTSGNHTQRAMALARILFGAHGIWVEPLMIEEIGVPGNQESALKTTLDIGRSLGWALVSQFYHPVCNRVVPLTDVDMEQWRQQGFKCEHQAGIEGS